VKPKGVWVRVPVSPPWYNRAHALFRNLPRGGFFVFKRWIL